MFLLPDATNRLAANVLFALHCAFSLFVTFGAFLTLANRGWIWAHVPAVLWTFSVNVADWTCPLTTWEDHFRSRADQPSSGGFIRHYIRPLSAANGDPRRLEMVIGVSMLFWNMLLYIVLLAGGMNFTQSGL